MYITAISLKNSNYSFLDINRYVFKPQTFYFWKMLLLTDCKTCYYPELTFQPQIKRK